MSPTSEYRATILLCPSQRVGRPDAGWLGARLHFEVLGAVVVP